MCCAFCDKIIWKIRLKRGILKVVVLKIQGWLFYLCRGYSEYKQSK